MSLNILGQFLKTAAAIAAGAGILLAASNAHAAANCSITTDPAPPTITEGGSVVFTGSVSGKPPATYDWTFGGGTTDGDTTQQTETVTYANAGSYLATLDGTNDRNDSCSANVTITVNADGGNTPPTANDDAASTNQDVPVNIDVLDNDTDPDVGDTLSVASVTQGSNGSVSNNGTNVTYSPSPGWFGTDTFSYIATDGTDNSNSATVTVTVNQVVGGNNPPTARGDTYATPVGKVLNVAASLVSGVLYNDFDLDGDPLTIVSNTSPNNGSLTFDATDGSFNYTPNATLGDNDNDSFTYTISDGTDTATATVNISILSDQPDFKIMMNYELGMHCTGFEFAYCCVLPPYNSILAQVVKPNTIDPSTSAEYARLLKGDHNNTDGLGRPVVMRDFELDGSGNFKKYFLEYYHDAQPRREGQGKSQTSTLISAVEGNSLFYHQTIYDSAAVDANGALVTGPYEGVDDVVLGDGDFNDPTDNYANGWLNHFYIYADLEGSNPNNSSLEADKLRLGVS